MFNNLLKRCVLASLSLSFSAVAEHAQESIKTISLSNTSIQTDITPDIGGRMLSIALPNKANFLRVGNAVLNQPQPNLSLDADYIGYMGHEIWAGPQSEWWTHQNLNNKRAADKASWPPDPYVFMPRNTVLEQSPDHVTLQSPASPISGLQFIKRYTIDNKKAPRVHVNVSAKNIRTESIAWDIWFNTRVHSNTQTYVPVADESDVRVKNIEDATFGPLQYTLNKGIFSLDMLPAPKGKTARRGKIMLQPSQGWMAGFHRDQVLIIQFVHQPKSAIHPEQGQVELYSEYFPNNLSDGLLEMEIHAPYKKLSPEEEMTAEEIWTLLEYKGKPTRAAHINFLKKNAANIGLKGL